MNKYLDNFSFIKNKGIDESTVYDTRMLFPGNKFISNNLLVGTFNHVKFVQADIKIKRTQKLLKIIFLFLFKVVAFTPSTIFKGKWILLEFNKKFTANFQVRDKWIENARVDNVIGKWDYKRIETENSVFNKKFLIYAYNPHDAFYVLTPSFMEKLLKISKNIKGRMMLCFVDNKLHVGVDKVSSSFKYNVYKKIDDKHIKESIMKDIGVVMSFINELNLENDIFK